MSFFDLTVNLSPKNLCCSLKTSVYLHVFLLYVDLELFVEKTSIYLHVFLLYVDLELFVEKTLVIERLLKRK